MNNFAFAIDFTNPWFYAVIGGVAALIVGLILILNFTVFANMRLRKAVYELDDRFQYLNALLIGQDFQLIQRLDSIASSNLTYVQVHAEFNRRFKVIRDSDDASCQSAINDLKDDVDSHNFKAVKRQLPTCRDMIANYEKNLSALHNDLLAAVAPEDECRKAILSFKERSRDLRRKLYDVKADVAIASPAFDRVFDLMEKEYASYDNLVASAQYDEAKSKLPRIGSVLDALDLTLRQMPDLCASVTTIVPGLLAHMENRLDELSKQGYPLNFIVTSQEITEMRKSLSALTEELQRLEIDNVPSRVASMKATIEEWNRAFDGEIEAKKEFDENCDAIYSFSSQVENKYIRLCNAMPEVCKVFFVSEQEQAKIDNIKNLINHQGAAKRALDALIHSITRQPYSVIIKRMRTLDEESKKAQAAIDDFYSFLQSLKEDSETAMKALPTYDENVHIAELRIEEIGVKAISEKYLPLVNDCFALIDEIHSCLHAPIHVERVNVLMADLRIKEDTLSREVSAHAQTQQDAEGQIVFAARLRDELADVRVFVQQAEVLFAEGQFVESCKVARSAVDRIKNQ